MTPESESELDAESESVELFDSLDSLDEDGRLLSLGTVEFFACRLGGRAGPTTFSFSLSGSSDRAASKEGEDEDETSAVAFERSMWGGSAGPISGELSAVTVGFMPSPASVRMRWLPKGGVVGHTPPPIEGQWC
jgi:hypothetical protein